MNATRRFVAVLVIAACAALALIVVVSSPPDVGTWLSDRPEIIAAGILSLAIVLAAVIVADGLRGPRV